MIFNLGGGAAAPKLTSIAVTTNPTKTAYNTGDSFDPSGMVVTAYFDDGSASVVTGYTCSPTTMAANTTNVTISYTSDGVTKTATVAVTVTWYLYNRGVKGTTWTLGGAAKWDRGTYIELGQPDSYNAGTMYTATTIDLSKYSKLSVRHTTQDADRDSFYGGIGITANSAHLGESSVNRCTYRTHTPNGTEIVTDVDLASINQPMYIMIASHNNIHTQAKTLVYEVWLTP